MKNKKGISLIVLVITIIIIIILAGTVILNLADNNPIESASKAKIASDLATFKTELAIKINNMYLKNPMLKMEDINSDEDGKGLDLIELIPSIKGTIYEKELGVSNGSLVLSESSTLDEEIKSEIKKEIQEFKSEELTANDIQSNPNKYYGKTVNYITNSNYSGKWQILYAEDEYIYLISSSYAPVSTITTGSGLSFNGDYNVYISGNSSDFIQIMGNDLNFTSLKNDKAVSVVGGPTIEQLAKSYNAVSHGEYPSQIYTELNDSKYSIGISKDDLSYEIREKLNQDEFLVLKGLWNGVNEINTEGYWVISNSISDNSQEKLFRVSFTSDPNNLKPAASIFSNTCAYNSVGFRPVVKLNKDITLVTSAKGSLNIK